MEKRKLVERISKLSFEQRRSLASKLGFKYENDDEQNLLAVYYVRKDNEGLAPSDFRSHLLEKLPHYLVPDTFVQLEQLPLLANGKVDRKALSSFRPEKEENYAAPRNEVEEQLVEIWAEVLEVEKTKIGIDTNFFEAGGHSLKAIMMESMIHKRFNVKASLLEIFKSPTIRGLYEYINNAAENRFASIPPAETKFYYVLSFAQRRMYILNRMDPESTAYNMPQVISLSGKIHREHLEEIFRKLIKRHESLRTFYEIVDGEPVQRIYENVGFEIEYYDPGNVGDGTRVTNSQGAVGEVNTNSPDRVITSFVRPFDLSIPPLFRVGLIKTGGSDYILVIDMHHIISDAASQDILVQDFNSLYEGNGLPELKLQYKDYANWQNQRYHLEEMKKQKSYWLKQFETEAPVINLPVDYPRPTVKSFEGNKIVFQLGEQETELLKKMALEEGATLYMVLLAIYNVFLSKVSGQEDIVVGTAAAGRRHADLERIVGIFVNTLALRNYPAPKIKFTRFLKELKQRTLEAFENQDYQFEDLVETVVGNRAANRNPLFDVSFAFQEVNLSPGMPEKEKKAPAAQQRRNLYEIDTAKFDMTLGVLVKEEEIVFTFVYSKRLFKERTIRLLAAWFESLTKQVLISPGKPLGNYYLSAGTEKELYHYLELSEQEIECIYPLTPTQRDIYLDCTIFPDAKAHRMIYYYVMKETIDIDALKKSLAAVHRIYPILRSRLAVNENYMYFAIRRAVELDFDYLDFSGEEMREKDFERKIKEISRPVTHGLDRGLVKHYLVKVSDNLFINMLSIHHIIFDGPSLNIFFERLHEIYEIYGGRIKNFNNMIKDHRVFIDFQRSMLEKFDKKAIENFWRKKFSNLEKIQSDLQGGTENRFVSSELLIEEEHLDNIRSYCRRLNISVPLYFRALYALLLRFHLGVGKDFIIREIFGGRDEHTRDFVGCFFHTVPLVFQQKMFAADKTVVEYFKDVFALMMGMGGKQHISILLQNRLLGEEGMTFYYNYRDFLTLNISNRRYYLNRVLEYSDNYYHPGEVQLITKNIEKGFFLELDYNETVFDGRRFLERLRYISRQIIDGMGYLRDIQFVPPGELREILEFSTGRPAEFPSRENLCQLFSRQSEKTPGRVVIQCRDNQLTYKKLDEKSNRLAHYLKDRFAVKPGGFVPVMLDRSLSMAESILAVWKAGAAYIPIDTQYPGGRILRILNDSGAPVLICRRQTIPPGLQEAWEGTIIDPDDHHGMVELPEQNTAAPDIETDMQGLAYIIYTSGSTGKPKGVMIEHIGMMNHIQAKIDDLLLSSQSSVAQNASHTFDISVWQFFVAMALGGKTVIYPDSLILEPAEFLSRLTKDMITILEVVPSYLSVMLEILRESHRPVSLYLDYLLVTGETVKPDLVERWFSLYPGIKMVNAYGPTEASDDITHHIMNRSPGTQRIPIGKPLQNLHVYIVGENMRLCPVGVKGEICVSGIGVGRGYLQDEKSTGEVFMEDPFSREPGIRLYKTGDLGCWLPDGTIDFFGRKDFQVKIRGFRIELGEIESHLVENPTVKEAVVIQREDNDETGNADKYLCAYFVPAGDAGETAGDELREYLANQLPDYMVPSCFIKLEQIPLTINGKIDRKALPVPGKDDWERGHEYAAPGDEIEEKLVEIWENVLGRKPIGVNENFFMLGGDSIKSILIASQMNRAGYKLEIRDMFQYPVISQLAHKVTRLERTADQSPITGIVPLTPIQQEFFRKTRRAPHHYNQSVVLHSQDGFEEKAVEAVFTKIQEHHDALRMSFYEENGKMVQINRGPDYPLSLQVFDYRNQADKRAAIKAMESKADEIQAAIDLKKGPLVQLGLFHLDDGDRLLIVIHHLVIDGVSWRILFEDIEALYKQFTKGESLGLPLKTDSFKLWSEELCKYADSTVFFKEKAYWAKLETTEVRQIKKDFDGENAVKGENVLSFTLNAEETSLLLTKVNEAFSTEVNDILLTALGLSIEKTWGITAVLVALEAHGREEVLKDMNITRTVGWFTSVYPVILNISYKDDLSRQIKEVKEGLHHVPARGIGYGILKYLTAAEYKKEIEFKLNPQICFNYLGQFDADIEKMSFQVADESAGNPRCIEEQRKYELDVTGVTADKKLVISITYNREQFKSETIETLLSHYKEALLSVISHCVSQEKKQLTPSDLTYKDLSIEDVGAIEALFDQ